MRSKQKSKNRIKFTFLFLYKETAPIIVGILKSIHLTYKYFTLAYNIHEIEFSQFINCLFQLLNLFVQHLIQSNYHRGHHRKFEQIHFFRLGFQGFLLHSVLTS